MLYLQIDNWTVARNVSAIQPYQLPDIKEILNLGNSFTRVFNKLTPGHYLEHPTKTIKKNNFQIDLT